MAHQIQTEPVKSADEHPLAHPRDFGIEPFGNFLGSLPREGEQGDPFRRNMHFPVQIKRAGDERFCFAASCPGKDQHRFGRVVVAGGSFLFGIERRIPPFRRFLRGRQT